MALIQSFSVKNREGYYVVLFGNRVIAGALTKADAMAKKKKMQKDYNERFIHVKSTAKRKAHTRIYHDK